MLSLPGKPYRSCDGVSRRNVLRAGFLGLAGLGLGDLLRARTLARPGASTGDDLSVTSLNPASPPVTVYRVTAQGVGADNTSTTMLQSIVR